MRSKKGRRIRRCSIREFRCGDAPQNNLSRGALLEHWLTPTVLTQTPSALATGSTSYREQGRWPDTQKLATGTVVWSRPANSKSCRRTCCDSSFYYPIPLPDVKSPYSLAFFPPLAGRNHGQLDQRMQRPLGICSLCILSCGHRLPYTGHKCWCRLPPGIAR